MDANEKSAIMADIAHPFLCKHEFKIWMGRHLDSFKSRPFAK